MMRCAQPLPERLAGGTEGSELIAIFTVVGCGLLSGGLYAIYSGWPYLVLERGFTQVIIGSVAATAGLLMLSLAWVLRELKAMRRDFEASAPVGTAYHGYAEEPVPAMPAPVLAPKEASPAGLGPVLGTGAAAVAGAAVAGAAVAGAAVAAAWPRTAAAEDEKAPEPAETEDRDLFGALVAERLAQEPAEEAEADAVGTELPPEPAPPGPDLFAPPMADEAEGHTATLPEESDEPVEIVAAKVQPLSQDEALAKSDVAEALPVETGFAPSFASEPDAEPEPAADDPVAAEPADFEHPDEPADEVVMPTPEPVEPPALAAEPEPEVDEFRALRESLTSELNAPSYAPRRVEPDLSLDRPLFGGGEEFFPGSARREPSFAPVEAEAEPAAGAEPPPPPAWPPRTEAAGFDRPLPPAVEQSAAPPPPPPPPVQEPQAEPEPLDEPEAPAPEERPSSDEGIVGAYQVGDAHFTIFADGSIRARTPDGEYSFASMDELKVYLASEKSRLGV